MAKKPKAHPVSPAAVRLLSHLIAEQYGVDETDAATTVELAQTLIERARRSRDGKLRLTSKDMEIPGFRVLRRIIVSETISDNDMIRSALERCFLRPAGHERRLRLVCDTARSSATLEISSW